MPTQRPAHLRPFMVAVAILVGLAAITACQPAVRARGITVSANPVSDPRFAGQCTWGAEEQWHAATGTYLAVSGDAWRWASTAAANGWTVTPVPSARSIVVFGRGIGGAHLDTGHVAWVTSVSSGPSGTFLQVVEMNWTYGPFNWDTRTVPAVPGMSYILAP